MVHRSDEKRENGYFHVWECMAAVTLANNNYIYIFILEFSLCNDCFCIFSFHLFCTFFHFPKRFPLKLSVATKHRHVDCRRSGSNKIIIICLFLFFHNNVFFLLSLPLLATYPSKHVHFVKWELMSGKHRKYETLKIYIQSTNALLFHIHIFIKFSFCK